MEPLIVLVVVTAAVLTAGRLGVRRLRPWPVAVRGGLAAMFTLTGVSHFVGMRAEMVSMVPPALPYPGLLVTVTGVLELAGVVGLLWRPTVPWAATGLGLLLVAMFPANVHAALAGVADGPLDALLPRTLLQVVFVAAATAVVVAHVRGRRAARAARPGTARPRLTRTA